MFLLLNSSSKSHSPQGRGMLRARNLRAHRHDIGKGTFAALALPVADFAIVLAGFLTKLLVEWHQRGRSLLRCCEVLHRPRSCFRRAQFGIPDAHPRFCSQAVVPSPSGGSAPGAVRVQVMPSSSLAISRGFCDFGNQHSRVTFFVFLCLLSVCHTHFAPLIRRILDFKPTHPPFPPCSRCSARLKNLFAATADFSHGARAVKVPAMPPPATASASLRPENRTERHPHAATLACLPLQQQDLLRLHYRKSVLVLPTPDAAA